MNKELIAKKVAEYIPGNSIVNLGIGLPTLVADYLPPEKQVLLHSENGLLGITKANGLENENLVNAGGELVGLVPGACSFDSSMSFSIIRGGHIDITVLGGLEVSVKGELANWIIPGKFVPGMGGAMDLTTNSKMVIVAMSYFAKGKPKLVNELSHPKTSERPIDLIVTELGVFKPAGQSFEIIEIFDHSAFSEMVSNSEVIFDKKNHLYS